MASEAPQPMIRVPALDATITAARVIRAVASQPGVSAMGNSGDCGHARQPGGGESVPPESACGRESAPAALLLFGQLIEDAQEVFGDRLGHH
jgi:hypothetical protein